MGFRPLTSPQAQRNPATSTTGSFRPLTPSSGASSAKQDDWFSGLVKSTAKPFAQLAVNARNVGLGVRSLGQIFDQQAFDQTQSEIERSKTEGIDHPTYGKLKPINGIGVSLTTGAQVASTVVSPPAVKPLLSPVVNTLRKLLPGASRTPETMLADALEVTTRPFNKKATVASLEKSGNPGGFGESQSTVGKLLGKTEYIPRDYDKRIAQSVADVVEAKASPV
jgi:hypothetical protein